MQSVINSVMAYLGLALGTLSQNDMVMAIWNTKPDKAGAGLLSAILAIVGGLLLLLSKKEAVAGLNKIPGVRSKKASADKTDPGKPPAA